ncbi:hypothetical protein ASPFODRAFT_126325 [Aspergillus luchuensis CBS 106.47]|uniref:Xylanolytic transcriptional activator regulatory domain-containing protein n=1 Tax=Aspergillus luchuensis (strain CBS 106.47) TaxID=1137211 RepID=A0A1M3TV20_ASPLC|nr:hypothetical protein ASPFODRAFT_126325 [Aspergillus luchuensis CBS 106.47]
MECQFAAKDDGRGTAPKSIVLMLKDRVELLERVLWLHSIDVDASIAKLRTERYSSMTRNPFTPPESLSQHPELDGALWSNSAFDTEGECDGEVQFFGSCSGRMDLLKLNARPSFRFRLNQACQDVETIPEVSQELKDHLIDLYFTWEQPWLQLVDEGLFRQSMPTNGRYFSPLLLNCILAIGSRYSERLETRSSPSDPNTAGRIFLEMAEVLLHFDLRSPSITTIQSLGIMAMIYVAIGSDAKGWLRHGMAIRLALDMGLNLDSAMLGRSHALPDEEKDLRKQIYWALYCTDKLWASYTGRVCTMLATQASVGLPMPIPENDGEVPTMKNKHSAILLPKLHHALSTQCQIQEKILMELYAPKRYPEARRHSFFDSCLFELKSWNYNLPADMQAKQSESSSILAHILVLHMVYHTSLILLAKPFLPKSQNSTSAEQDSSWPGALKVSSICMEAAKEICLLGEHYRKVFGSFRQSPITVTHCTLSAVLLILDSGVLEREFGLRSRMNLINSCLMTLRELSDSWMPAKQYWKGILRIVKHRQSKSAENHEPAVKGQSNKSNGYDLCAEYSTECHIPPDQTMEELANCAFSPEWSTFLNSVAPDDFDETMLDLPLDFDFFSRQPQDPDFTLS